MRFLLFPLLSSVAWAAAGDISAVRIINNTCTAVVSTVSPCNGSVAEIDLSQGGGSTPGVAGTYSLGLGTGNSPTNAKVVFTVTSNGYDTSGNTTTIARTVYGQYQLRKPYPNNATMDETDGTDILTVRLVLSDFVYSSDTATVTITAPAGVGFYAQGGTNAGTTTNLSVTNNSTLAYPTSVCRWAWPVPFTAITGNFTLEAVCFNRFARNGKPLAALKFTVTDEHSHSVTYTVNDMTASTADAGDQYKVLVYQTTVDVSTLDQGDTLTANFKAYPWVGDSGAVLDSNTGASERERLYDLPLLNNKTGGWGGGWAVIDSTNGQTSNATTWIASSQSAAESAYSSATTNSYRTLGYALDAMRTYNNALASPNTHNDPGGGTFLLVGSYTYSSTGRWASQPTTQKTWATVTRLSTVAKASAIWAGNGSSDIRCIRIKLDDITVSSSSVVLTDSTTSVDNALWLNNNTLNLTYDGAIGGYDVAFATKNSVTALRTGFSYSGSTKIPWALVRGNVLPETMANQNRTTHLYCILGNKNIRIKPIAYGDSSGIYRSENSIAAFNASFVLTAGWTLTAIGGTASTALQNVAIVQNIAEVSDGSAGEALFLAASDASSEDGNNNYLIWHNTLVGQRANVSYNDYNLNGGSPKYRLHWSMVGNNFDDINIVCDTDSHGGTADGVRIGGWPVRMGVGLAGNAYYNRTVVSAANNYSPEFAGILAYVGNNADPAYVSNKSYSGTSAGNGDYHLTGTSPSLNLIPSGGAVLPYDLDGVARRNDGTGAAGAYEYGSTRRKSPVIN